MKFLKPEVITRIDILIPNQTTFGSYSETLQLDSMNKSVHTTQRQRHFMQLQSVITEPHITILIITITWQFLWHLISCNWF